MSNLHCWHAPLPRRLRTGRFELHLLAARDTDELATFLAAERQHLRWYALGDDTCTIADRMVAASGDAVVHYLVRAQGRLVGGLTLEVDVGASVVEVSCWLGAFDAGRGVATEIAGVLRDLILAGARADEVVLRCARDNYASARIARRLGFLRAPDRDGTQCWVARCLDLAAWHDVWQAAAPLGGTIPGDAGEVHIATGGTVLVLSLENAQRIPYVIASARIGDNDLFAPESSLAHASTLAIGALTTRDGQLVLRYGCAPEALTAHALKLLVHEAARLHSLAPRRIVDAAAFAFAL
jgi:RimJ/RimL family protein N-acetyltransferase